MKTETKREPLKAIIARLREECDDYNIKSWSEGRHYTNSARPPDIHAVLDQLKIVPELAAGTKSPMRQLFSVAQTLSTSENTEKAVIGGVLLQCHREIEALVSFCKNLEAGNVDYPRQQGEDDEDKE